jgi:hypothetical protein
VESVRERIRREYEQADKIMGSDQKDRIKRWQAEEFANARAWIKVAQIRGRPLSAREQESLNI